MKDKKKDIDFGDSLFVATIIQLIYIGIKSYTIPELSGSDSLIVILAGVCFGVGGFSYYFYKFRDEKNALKACKILLLIGSLAILSGLIISSTNLTLTLFASALIILMLIFNFFVSGILLYFSMLFVFWIIKSIR